MPQDGLDDVHVVIDAELVRHGQHQRIRLGNRLILLQLGNQLVRFGGVAATKNCAGLLIEETDFIAVVMAGAKIAPGPDRPSGQKCCG